MGHPHPASTPIDFAAMGASPAGPSFDRGTPRRSPPVRLIVWLIVFLVLLVGGGVLLISGIVDIVGQNNRVLDAAVAEGRADTSEQAITFVATRSREYFVYASLDNSNSDRRDFFISGTSCIIRFADGRIERLSGSDQSSTVTVGDTSSIGSFTAPEGAVTMSCRQTRTGSFRFIVSTAEFGVLRPILFIIGGAFALVASLFAGLAARGARTRRRRQDPPNLAVTYGATA